MNKLRVFGGRAIGLALIVTVVVVAGCCLVTPQERILHAATGNLAAAETIPIVVTLVAQEGEALTASRKSVLARLRLAMSEEAFAAVRTYETLPVVALVATPEVTVLLLTLPDVRSIEADRSFEPL